MKTKPTIITITISVIFGFVIGFTIGKQSELDRIIQKADYILSDYPLEYQHTIEIILFGEYQE